MFLRKYQRFRYYFKVPGSYEYTIFDKIELIVKIIKHFYAYDDSTYMKLFFNLILE